MFKKKIWKKKVMKTGRCETCYVPNNAIHRSRVLLLLIWLKKLIKKKLKLSFAIVGETKWDETPSKSNQIQKKGYKSNQWHYIDHGNTLSKIPINSHVTENNSVEIHCEI